MQSLNQNMTFSSFEQNGWKWSDDKLKVKMKMKTFKCQKTIIQTIKKVRGKFLAFFLVKILVMNSYLKNHETECFIQRQPTRGALQK